MKLMNARRVNLNIKPCLSDEQKLDRLEYVLSQVRRAHGHQTEHKFKDLFDTVMVDESWFYMKRVNNTVIAIDGVVVPRAPTCQHKAHIQKVMFLVAVARPRVDPLGNEFDGKIGLWQCTEMVQAKRKSKNRDAGTWEEKPRTVDSEFYRHLFTKPGGVLAKIKERMPWMHNRVVRIQHDGARPHTGCDTEQLIAQAGSVNGWHFVFHLQPSNSPDTNILDLGFFHALKCHAASLKINANTIPQLIAKIRAAFQSYPPESLDHVWGHWYDCLNEILKSDGDNQYKPPHTGGRVRAIEEGTSVNLSVDLPNYNRVYEMFH
jgi:hypothetical protein